VRQEGEKGAERKVKSQEREKIPNDGNRSLNAVSHIAYPQRKGLSAPLARKGSLARKRGDRKKGVTQGITADLGTEPIFRLHRREHPRKKRGKS